MCCSLSGLTIDAMPRTAPSAISSAQAKDLADEIEQAKARANRIDFEDMLTLAVELYETDADALALTHRRYSWSLRGWMRHGPSPAMRGENRSGD